MKSRLLPFLALLFATVGNAPGAAPDPAWQARVEADWLLQDARNPTKPARLVTCAADATGSNDNLAFGKPATQSSVSPWTVDHPPPGAQPDLPLAQVIGRGLKLAASLRRLGASTDQAEADLHEIASLGASADMAANARRTLYFRARWAVRELALTNPLLTFDSLLFVKRAPGMFPHMSD